MSAVALKVAPRARFAGAEWTPSRTRELTRLRSENKSASAIATTLGVTRAAVLGAIKRQRERGDIVGARVARRPTLAWVAPVPVCPSLPLFEAAYGVPKSKGVPFVDLKTDECKWFDENSTTTCCGAPTRKGGSYCDAHRALVYRGGAK